MFVDYAGTSPQTERGISCVMNYTYAYSLFAVKCLTNPLIPNNEGGFRPVHISAPEGCILNPNTRRWWPVRTGQPRPAARPRRRAQWHRQSRGGGANLSRVRQKRSLGDRWRTHAPVAELNRGETHLP